MITFVRTAVCMPGKLGDALAWAHKIAGYINDNHGLGIEVQQRIGGNFNTIGWVSRYDSLAAMEEAMGKLFADQDYWAMLSEVGDLFVPGEGGDRIWRKSEVG